MFPFAFAVSVAATEVLPALPDHNVANQTNPTMKTSLPHLSRLLMCVVALCCGRAAHGATMAIDSLTGPVTQNEIDSFKAYMLTQVPPETPWGDLNGTGHNAW